MIRTYSELRRLETLEDRFEYLSLRGKVAETTFGFDRWLNQEFYRSKQWRDLRHYVIARDEGCDLGVEGYEIHERPAIHHMNPMTVSSIVDGNADILDPEYLVMTSLLTHNAIHYGDAKLLRRGPVERKPGDTRLW